jgi:hypothetical protein
VAAMTIAMASGDAVNCDASAPKPCTYLEPLSSQDSEVTDRASGHLLSVRRRLPAVSTPSGPGLTAESAPRATVRRTQSAPGPATQSR